MGKLDPVKVKWIIKEKEKGSKNADIARSMNITTRWVQMLYAQYKKTNTIPILKKPGRPKKRISAKMTKIVLDAQKKHECCATELGKIIDRGGIHIPRHVIHKILKRNGLASELPNKNKRRKWVRYERTYSNSLWHTDWKQLDNKKWLICYLDDASRFITGYGVFKNATGKNAISVLRNAIKQYGKPASILTDHGTQFYANESKNKKRRGVTLFENELVKLDIKHILSGVHHPQTNGKIERFYGDVARKQRLYNKTVPEVIIWHNDIKPHRSLNMEELETPSMAFKRKMPESGAKVIDGQTGEVYDVK
jgi:putative transposase